MAIDKTGLGGIKAELVKIDSAKKPSANASAKKLPPKANKPKLNPHIRAGVVDPNAQQRTEAEIIADNAWEGFGATVAS